MHHDAAVSPGKGFGEAGRQKGRGRAGQDAVFRAGRIQPGEDGTLHRQVFGRVFLDVSRIGQRLIQSGRRVQARPHRRGAIAVQKIIGGQVGQKRVDIVQRPGRRVLLLVPQRHVMAGAREADRPGPADEAGARNCNFAHLPLSVYLRILASASLLILATTLNSESTTSAIRYCIAVPSSGAMSCGVRP